MKKFASPVLLILFVVLCARADLVDDAKAALDATNALKSSTKTLGDSVFNYQDVLTDFGNSLSGLRDKAAKDVGKLGKITKADFDKVEAYLKSAGEYMTAGDPFLNPGFQSLDDGDVDQTSATAEFVALHYNLCISACTDANKDYNKAVDNFYSAYTNYVEANNNLISAASLLESWGYKAE